MTTALRPPGRHAAAPPEPHAHRKVPNVKRLVLRSMPDEMTRAAALKKGEVDIAYLLTGSVADDVQHTPGFRLVAPKELQGTFWLDLPDQWDPKFPWREPGINLIRSFAYSGPLEDLRLKRP